MMKFGPLFKLLAALALLAGLAACDSGGVGTSSNPNLTTANSGFVYTGPAARNIDVSNFQFYLWRNVNQDGRCGGCHNSRASTPESPLFFDTSNVNVAYDASIAYVDLVNPLNSPFVAKLNGGHNCWESVPSICGTLIAGWIEDWKNANNGGVASRQINLVPPDDIRDPGEAKSFPANATTTGLTGKSFANTVYPLLTGTTPVIADGNCQNCHEEIATPLPQAPFFASGDIDAAYEAAKAKMDIDNPINSRFVQRLIEQHNCWSDCDSDWRDMRDVIAAFAGDILPTPIDPALVTSKALTLPEGIVASGGNRHETDQFAIWEFKTGTGLTAFDTSGLDPAIHLSMIGSVNWVPGYGLEFTGGRAQADTINSDKLYTYIRDTGEYAIEAWVIPSNVSQQDTNIVSYSGGDTTRNFTLGQTLYNYESFNRIDTPSVGQANGEPMLTTGDSGMEIAQASLQHVVVNYDPFSGRSVYVNGQLVPGLTDPAGAPTSVSNDWDDGLAFVLGGEIGGNRAWAGQLKMVAMHSRALTPAQIQQNFDVGVGQKFYLLFYVGDHLGEDPADPQSFIVFEVAQFDGFSYLFNKPTFINLDPAWVPGSIAIRGLRIGINGKEALAGQAFANLDVTVDSGSYDPLVGQELSPLGTIIALEKGATSDEFFLTFEMFAGASNVYTDTTPSVPTDPADPAAPVASDIGLRTFEEIYATIAEITGVPVSYDPGDPVGAVYLDYIQQLPTVEDISAFLPSHQMAIAQLALTSCSELVDNNPGYFSGFDFGAGALTAFDSPAKRAQVIDPLLNAAMNVDPIDPANNLSTQPDATDVSDSLGSQVTQNLDPGLSNDDYESLINELLIGSADTTARTAQIVKAVCAVAAGSAVMIVQ